MAEVKISELTSATTPLAGTETVPIVQGGVTKKVAVSEIGGGGGSVAWGDITGTLGDQTDLAAAFLDVDSAISTKQDTLLSGYNIKTINSESLLGSSNIKLPKLISSFTTLTQVSNVSTETLIASTLIPANTLASASILDLMVKGGQIGAATATMRVYINTSNSLSGATLLATGSTLASGVGTLQRMMVVNNSTLYTMNTTSGLNFDFNSYAQTAVTINRANAYYLIVSVSNSLPATGVVYGIKLVENA